MDQSNQSFVFYESYAKGVRKLAPAEQLAVYNALIDYMFYGIEPQLEGAAEGMFRYYMALAETAAACQSSDAITWLPPAVYKVYGEYDAIQQAVDEVLPLLDQLNAKEKERVENQLGYWAKTKTLLSETKENI